MITFKQFILESSVQGSMHPISHLLRLAAHPFLGPSKDTLEQLVKSLHKEGVKNPINLHSDLTGGGIVSDGNTRLLIQAALGHTMIPATVMFRDDEFQKTQYYGSIPLLREYQPWSRESGSLEYYPEREARHLIGKKVPAQMVVDYEKITVDPIDLNMLREKYYVPVDKINALVL